MTASERERQSRVCHWCEKRVRTFVPRGGDGSRDCFVRHEVDGSLCKGSHKIAPIYDVDERD
jgi:hypothetical protein